VRDGGLGPAPQSLGRQHDEDAAPVHVTGAAFHQGVLDQPVDQPGQRALVQVNGVLTVVTAVVDAGGGSGLSTPTATLAAYRPALFLTRRG
jgi:hypothetical protein